MSSGTVSSSESVEIDYVDLPILGDEEQLPTDPMAALDKLTQLNGSSSLAGANACGAVSLVGATIAMHGYAGLRHLSSVLADELSDDTHGELERLAGDIATRGSGATYGALANYALVIYRRYRGMDGGIDYTKLQHLMKMAGFTPPNTVNDDDIARTVGKTGQCWPAKISIFGDEGDHWILVARDTRGLFIFDPYPRGDGSQIIRTGEVDWKRYVEAIGKDEDGKNTIGFLPK
jgi:hypothetical protein